MSEQQRAATLKTSLMKQVDERDIAGYLHDEIAHFVYSLNSWKLEKLEANFGVFKKYVFLLDDQNTKQMTLLLTK